MIRTVAFVLTATLLLGSLAVRAQSQGCVERPVGPAVDGAALGTMPQLAPGAPGPARGRGMVAMPQMPSMGTECIAVMPPVRDVLRGEPAAAGGLLRDTTPGRQR